MAAEQPARTGQPGAQDVDAIFRELWAMQDKYFNRLLRRYSRLATEHRLFFRAIGMLIILLSVSIPFLTTLDGVWKDIALPVVALLVAGLTGLTAFFHWEQHWKSYRQAQFSLLHLLAIWELEMTEARHAPDSQQAIARAVAATRELFNQAAAVSSAETEEFFKRLQAPPGKA